MTDRPVGGGPDLGSIERAVVHPQGLEQLVAHERRERLALDLFEDAASQVDAQVGVGETGPDREAQPGVGDAPTVGVEGARIDRVVVATEASMVKPAVWLNTSAA